MNALTATNVTPLRDYQPDLLRVPPLNSEAEQALLGAILIQNRAYYRVCDFLKPAHFGNSVHARIYESIGKMIDSGQEANPVTLKHLFDGEDALKGIGGGQFLARLAGAAVTVLNTEDYARVIVDCAQRRQLIALGEELIRDAFAVNLDRSAADIASASEALIAEIIDGPEPARQTAALGHVATSTLEEIDRVRRIGDELFIKTGLEELDKVIGGLMPGNLEILASRPGMGKTALGLGIATRIAAHDRPALFFSLEQTSQQLVQRQLAADTGVSILRQAKGNVDLLEMQALFDAVQDLRQVPLYFDDHAGLTIGQICYRARRAKRRHKIGLVVVDHMQIVVPNTKKEARRLELDEISMALKRLAKELEIPVLALSQLNRGVEGRENKRPTLADLRESGGLEQDADRVFFLYREEYYASQVKITKRSGESDDAYNKRHADHGAYLAGCRGKADLFIAKNRHGIANKNVELAWNAERLRFYDLDKRSYDER